MENLVLVIFCAELLACIIFGIPILCALGFGLVLFLLYGRYKGFGWGELFRIALEGVYTAHNILITFFLIGMLTALWRAAGTLPVIVCYATRLIRPSILLLMTFLLNCFVSMLTGTAFGTAATMGVICGSIGAAMNVDIRLVGGAMLSGVYFGDRCSPVSTSALLVAELTGTQVMDNIHRMIRSAAVPFAVSGVIYGVLGFMTRPAGEIPDLAQLFGAEFDLSPICVLPAVVIFALAMMRVNVKRAMLASILTAIPIALVVQKAAPGSLAVFCVTGFKAVTPEVAKMLNGGGITSMLKVAGIVCIASSYSGIFKKTGLLDGVRQVVENLAAKTNSYTAMLCTAAVSSMIACNQSLGIMLTHQLCGNLQKDKGSFALDLEDSVVVVAPLVPWSIAGGLPLTAVGAPISALPLACYLYLLPLWRLLGSMRSGARRGEAGN